MNNQFLSEEKAENLAEQYDTPLFVYDGDKIREQFRRLESAYSRQMDNFSIHYAVKANFNPEIVRTLMDEGANLDCASGPELELANELGADFEHVMYTAPYNRKEEIERAIELGATVNIDGMYILEKLDDLPETLCVRIDPGIGKGEGDLVFAGGDSQFGVHEEEAVEIFRKAKERGVENFGLHMMTGSNVRDEEYFAEITERLLEIAGSISEQRDIEFEFIDIGGGIGVAYHPEDKELDIDEMASMVSEKFRKGVERNDIGNPELRMEPGRFLVAESGLLLSKVTGVKEKGERTFVGIDTGMHHIIRPMLLDSYHEVNVIGSNAEKSQKTVVGPVCSSTDVIADKRMLPETETGDYVTIGNAGAYGFSMASHWNTRPLPAEVKIENGKTEIIRERENWRDVFHGTEIEDR